jgi:hypothetical protein
LNWRQDPPTQKQIWLLKQLGSTATPRSKGEACDLIAARVPRPTTPDPAESIDKAAERVMKSLRAEETAREAAAAANKGSEADDDVYNAEIGSASKPRSGREIGTVEASMGHRISRTGLTHVRQHIAS